MDQVPREILTIIIDYATDDHNNFFNTFMVCRRFGDICRGLAPAKKRKLGIRFSPFKMLFDNERRIKANKTKPMRPFLRNGMFLPGKG